jgi:hypothetical protein
MNENLQLQNKVAQCRLDVKKAESQLREALAKMQHGSAKALAEYHQECDRLKEEANRVGLVVEKEKEWLRLAEGQLERGFE